MAQQFGNNCSTILSGAITAGDQFIDVAQGGGNLFPNLNVGDFMQLTLEDVAGNIEIVQCYSKTGDRFQVYRAQEGTSAQSFPDGTRFELRLTQAALEEFVQKTNDTIDGGTF